MSEQQTTASRQGRYEQLLAHRFRPPILFLAFLVLCTSASLAQLTSADILGTVTDPSGASVSTASVTLTNLGTNDVRTAQSNGSAITPLLSFPSDTIPSR